MDINTNYKCEICNKFYKSSQSLCNHNRNIHSKKKYKCKFCNKYFSYNQSLNKHANYSCKLNTDKIIIDNSVDKLKN